MRLSSYSVTPTGVQLHKGEELGMFNMGSTIALIYECPKEYQVVPAEGQAVKMGERLVEFNQK